jgi:hypothetical protein
MRTARSNSIAQKAGSDHARPLDLLRPVQSEREERLRQLVSDVAVYSFILLIGAFQLTHYLHTPDFMNDVTYPDLARSILDHGSYQIRFLPETTFPPGFPLILAVVGLFFGLSPAALFPVIAVSAMLGLIATYEFLRRVEGRVVAAAISLFFASCPVFFSFATTIIYPEIPYFLMSMLALLVALRLDSAERRGSLVSWVALLSATLVLAVLIRSVGVALLAGLAAWIATSLLLVPDIGRRRLRRFVLPLVIGVTAQVCWSVSAHRRENLEWQLPGYPQSYISQLRVKNGYHPELGEAHLADIPPRIGRNLVMRAAGFSHFLTRRNVSEFWSSPAIFGPLMLILIGVGYSIWTAAGQFYDWYFLCYEFIFILWPWGYRDRFLIPVVPLACLYLWRGTKAVKNYAIRQPGAAGASFILLGSVLCLSSAAFAFGITTFPINPEHIRGDHLQTIAATLFWGILTAIGFWMLKGSSPKQLRDGTGQFTRLSRLVESKSAIALRTIAIVIVAAVVLSGTGQVMAIGRSNVNHDMTAESFYPMMKASEWIGAHEPLEKVIMASEPEFVFHFAHRRTVWFPPISDPRVLMDGILRHHIGVILVVHQAQSYWLPPEDVCFQALQRAYPGTFWLAHQDVDTWVYDVISPSDALR